ncbi:MAG: circularly permuted type 2 ATP-grasp protein [Myxococcota bacterium]
MTRRDASAHLNARALSEGRAALERYRAMAARHRMERLTPVLRPYVLTASQLAALEAATVAFGRAMEQALAAWAKDGAFAADVLLPPRFDARAKADVLAGRAFGHVRFDFLFEPDGGLGLLEVQAGDPSGMGIQHALAQHFAPDAAEVHGTLDSVAASLRRALAPTPAEAGLVVFAIQRGATLQFDHALVAAVFRDAGVDAVIVDPDELVFDGAALTWQGRRVTLVVRDSLEDLLEPKRVAGSRALLEAWLADAVVVHNPAGSIVADHKVLLALLGTQELPEAARRALLPVEKLDAASRPGVLARRASLVLKPSDGFGGFGVVVGPAVDDAAWTAAVDAALASGRPHVVQAFGAHPSEDFPVPDGAGGVRLERRNVVISTWLHSGRFGGVFARVHAGPVVNVHQGGGLLPVCVVNG